MFFNVFLLCSVPFDDMPNNDPDAQNIDPVDEHMQDEDIDEEMQPNDEDDIG